MNYFNQDAEVNLLGSILNKNDVLIETMLDTKDFYKLEHQIIYNAMLELYRSNKPIDITTLATHLKHSLKEVGGVTYLGGLLNTVNNIRNAKAYAEIIKDFSNKRFIFENLHLALKEIEQGANTEEIKTNLLDKLHKINTANNDDDGNIEKGLEETIEEIEKAFKFGGDITGIKTHYSILDKVLNGLNKQDFIILAARPSMGKTAFALNLFKNVGVRSKAKTALFNLEMSKAQMYKRLLSIITGIEMDKVKKGLLNDKEWTEISNTSGLLAQLKNSIRVFDKVMTLNGIIAECKKMSKQGGLDVVIIDYLQLISINGKQSREQEVSSISRQLKMLAKELDCTVIALSQLSRACEARTNKRPMLSDLRESGSIEQDADIVMFLYRDEYYNPDTEDKDNIECIISKNRNGELGTIDFTWIPQLQRVSEYIRR